MLNMKLTIFIGTMIHGGAHRVACIQANELAQMGYEVTLTLVVGSNIYPYDISEDVKIVELLAKEDLEFSSLKSKLRRKIISIPTMVKYLKDNKPDIVLSHIQSTNRESIISCKIASIPIIVFEHTSHLLPKGILGKIAYFDRRFLYRLADKVALLTKYDKENFYDLYNINSIVIPNPCSFTQTHGLNQIDREKTILAVGDLNRIEIKGWDTLLSVFAKISKNYPEWKLQFAGTGDKGKSKLTQMAKNFGISDKIEFLGNIKKLNLLFQRKSIFILTSRNEGLPMALIEAMSQGNVCIAFDCKTGPADIIRNRIDGILVEDQNINEMCAELTKLLDNIGLRSQYSHEAVTKSLQFSKQRIVNKWNSLIQEIISDR